MVHRSVQNLVTLMLVVTTVGAVGQIMLKVGMGHAGTKSPGLLGIMKIMLTEPWVVVGLILYALNTILYLKLLNEYPLSLVFPMIAFSYVLVTLLSVLLLNERIPALRFAGLIAIVVGVVLYALSARGDSGIRSSTAASSAASASPTDRSTGS